MPHCSTLKEKLNTLEENTKSSRSLLEEYKRTGDKKLLKELREKREKIKESISSFFQSEEYEASVKNILSEWYPKEDKDDFLDKVKIANDGQVVIEGNLDLESIKSLPHFPLLITEIKGALNLNNLTIAEGLKLPDSVGVLYLERLTSAEGLEFPDIVEVLNLQSLTTAEDLELPDSVEWLYLESLTTAEGLELPPNLKTLLVSDLPEEDKEILREKYPHLFIG